MTRNLMIVCDWTLPPFFRKSTKRYLELDFWGVKNAWKTDENYAFWRTPRTIHRPTPSFQTDAQNHAKWRQSVSKITAKLAWENMNPGITIVRNARRRLTCEKASNCVHFCRSRCCFAHAMDAKIAKNRRKFTTKWQWKIRSPVLQW